MLDLISLKVLKKVLLIGEALKASDVAKWEDSGAEIYSTCSPAECTVTSTVEIAQTGEPERRESDPSIGKGIGTCNLVRLAGWPPSEP